MNMYSSYKSIEQQSSACRNFMKISVVFFVDRLVEDSLEPGIDGSDD